jgi:hypothetical protein
MLDSRSKHGFIPAYMSMLSAIAENEAACVARLLVREKRQCKEM